MKALSLIQPWATLVVHGLKNIETRSWRTGVRGEIAIHASKGFPSWAKALCYEEPFRSALANVGYNDLSELPTGAVVGTCRISDCRKVSALTLPGEPERSFGDYTPGRFLWFLCDQLPMPPVPAKGNRGFWEWEPPVVVTKEEMKEE